MVGLLGDRVISHEGLGSRDCYTERKHEDNI